MENTNKTTIKTISFSGLLTIAFIVLKLCHVIDWSWIWVLSPLWISAGLAIILIVVILIVVGFLTR